MARVHHLTRVQIHKEYLIDRIDDPTTTASTRKELRVWLDRVKIDEICFIARARARRTGERSQIGLNKVIEEVYKEMNMRDHAIEAQGRAKKVRRAYGKNRNKPPLTMPLIDSKDPSAIPATLFEIPGEVPVSLFD